MVQHGWLQPPPLPDRWLEDNIDPWHEWRQPPPEWEYRHWWMTSSNDLVIHFLEKLEDVEFDWKHMPISGHADESSSDESPYYDEDVEDDRSEEFVDSFDWGSDTSLRDDDLEQDKDEFCSCEHENVFEIVD